MLNGWLKKLQRLSFIEKILSYLDSANPTAENSTDLTDISYPQWQNRFLIARLNLALWLAFLFFLSKSILSLIFFMLGKYPSLEEWEIARILVHLTLLGCILILRSSWGDRHLGLIFLCFSWSVTMIEQISDTVTGNVNPEFFAWMLTFFSQATLIPVRWFLHLISQATVLGYYFGVNQILGFDVAPLDGNFMKMCLGIFWVCLICDISVYLYESLQKTEFNTKLQLETTYQKLHSTEVKYRIIFDNSVEGIFQSTPDGHYLYGNPALAEIFGYDSPEEMTAKVTDIGKQIYVNPNCRDEFIDLISRDGSVFKFEYQAYRADGSVIWVSENARSVRDPKGNLIAYEGDLEDITERKWAETEIKKAQEIEKELSQLKSQFISMTSHVFRTPLTTILASAEALEYYSHKWDEEKKLTYLRRIQDKAQHMTGLLNDMLVIGKKESGNVDFNPAPLNLENFCRGLIEDIKLTLGSQYSLDFVLQEAKQLITKISDKDGVNLSILKIIQPDLNEQDDSVYNAPPESENESREQIFEFVLIDEKLLRYILFNLLWNAVKYSPQGGHILLKLSYLNNYAIFQVQDEGMGIPAAEQKYLFESFYRAQNAINISGTGLGLTIVKNFVDLHRGQIFVESEVGVGTTFTVILPLNLTKENIDEKNSSD
ncbi:MAG: PAS domain S-box protein [Okeania sp. SIO3B5]|uniref:PAS domain-containing sensor histidine kinase n=1 Tax=Okeania sp. SIO3B5 TaxID=2607811 RepID=UPI0014015F53|nr:PAS domain-containing sensor histidine kinase [Okeania sp. SIO3B5]NEO52202.1 PAS domain S-box protein [Okeania sp. SIO3B5]